MGDKDFVYKHTFDLGNHVNEIVKNLTNDIDKLVLAELQDGTLFKLIDMCQEELDRRRHEKVR